MLDLAPSQVAEALGVSVTPGTATEDPPRHITTVVTDSRDVIRGSLFMALKGERVDGHDFLSAAFDSGAAAAIVTREVSGLTGPSIVVDDAVAALGQLATTHLQRLRAANPDLKVVRSEERRVGKECGVG